MYTKVEKTQKQNKQKEKEWHPMKHPMNPFYEGIYGQNACALAGWIWVGIASGWIIHDYDIQACKPVLFLSLQQESTKVGVIVLCRRPEIFDVVSYAVYPEVL